MRKGTARLEHAVGQDTLVPPREGWPEPPARTEAGDLLTDVIMATFRLNGRLLDVAQRLAAKGEITAPWWQVLGGVLDAPRGVAAIARRMGLTRQGVQRVADILVKRGLAEYLPNPGASAGQVDRLHRGRSLGDTQDRARSASLG